MKLIISQQFVDICKAITDSHERKGEKSLIGSDDQYQSRDFCGGWDDELHCFAFSYYAPDGGDYIFTFTLEDARRVVGGEAFDPPLEYWKNAPPLRDE